jgi:hypothetical protein
MSLTLLFSFTAAFDFSFPFAAVTTTEGNAATMITLICAGWLPHEQDPSGAASLYVA